jgi:purine-binding chemotaxis protein CheW
MSDNEVMLEISELKAELEKRDAKIDKLKKYIANVEEDSDRINDELLVANSFKVCFNSVTNPLFMVDASLNITFANPAFLDIANIDESAVEKQLNCADVLQCAAMRPHKCLLKECFESGKPIMGYRCSYINSMDRKFRLVVDAFPVHNVATNKILGGFEIFREVIEDTVAKYLMFSVSGEEYGLSTKDLRDILSMTHVFPIPKMPSYVLGSINLRDKIVPVIDIGRRLGLQSCETSSENGVIMIMDTTVGSEKATYGFVADKVNEIVDLGPSDIDRTATQSVICGDNCISGVAKVDGRSRVLIDFNKLVPNDEARAFASATE